MNLRRFISILVLVIVVCNVICGMQHICMAGHFQHPPYGWWHYLNDALWAGGAFVAMILCLRANLLLKKTLCLMLGLLILARFLGGSFGGALFILELPTLLIAATIAVIGLFASSKDLKAMTPEEKKVFRKTHWKRWGIFFASVACLIIFTFLSIKLYKFIRLKTTPVIEIIENTLPLIDKVSLAPGQATILKFPDGKTLAFWCERTGWMKLPEDSDLDLRYAEVPFGTLELTWIDLPGRGRTNGPLKSYIRRGPVMTWSSGPGHEYTLYIDDKYTVKLREDGDQAWILPVKITVTKSTERESIRSENEVEYLVGQLKLPDPKTRKKAIEDLQEELMLGNIYAVPKWQYIIDKVKPIDNDPDPQVQEQAAHTLRVLGDADSIMKVISPEPKGKYLTIDEAQGLGQFAIRCKKNGDKQRIFDHVKTFVVSDNPELRAFAIAFFTFSEQDTEVKKAIRNAMNDPSSKVREAAVFALGNKNEGVAERIEMLQDSDPEVIIVTLESSVGRGAENEFPISKIKDFLKNDNIKIRLAAIHALQFKNSKESEILLIPLTYDQDDEIRVEATYALSGEKTPKVYKRMLELLQDKNQLVKIRALQNLYLDDYIQAIPEIEKFLKTEKDPEVLEVAKESLNHLIRYQKENRK